MNIWKITNLTNRWNISQSRLRHWGMSFLSFCLVFLLHGVGAGSFWVAMVSALGAAAQVNPTPANPVAEQLVGEGRSHYNAGDYPAAFAQWETAQKTYAALGNPDGVSRTLIYQAQALESLGQTRRSCNTLLKALSLPQQDCAQLKLTDLEAQSFKTKTQIIGLRLLGESLGLVGQLNVAEIALKTSQTAAADQFPQEAIAAQLALLNTQAIRLSSQDLSATRRELGDLGEILKGNSVQSPEPKPLEVEYVRELSDLLSAYQKLITENADTALTTQAQAQTHAIRLGIEGIEVGLDSLRLLQERAASLSYDQLLRTPFFSKQRSLLQQNRDWANQIEPLVAALQQNFKELGGDRTAIYGRINLVQSLLRYARLRQQEPINTVDLPVLVQAEEMAALLEEALVLAQQIQDPQAINYVTGYLGELYRTIGDRDRAEVYIRDALAQSQSRGATDLSYRWQWRMGQLLAEKNQRSQALLAYRGAVQDLDSLRRDLVATNREIQFSFRDQVEPVYRDYVDLLLQPGSKTSEEDLKTARNIVERLQLAEIDNYFREPCAIPRSALDDLTEEGQAVLYSIVLPDRLELILKLPGKQSPLKRFSTLVDQATLEGAVDRLTTAAQVESDSDSSDFFEPATQIYNWMIAPLRTSLDQEKVKTLVFVFDSVLSAVPVAALYDPETQHHLVQDFSIAIAPSIQLPKHTTVTPANAFVLAAAMTQERTPFRQLNAARGEIEQVQQQLPGEFLIDEAFTVERVKRVISDRDFSIVHFATHGVFSSKAEDTYLLAWDQQINVNELSQFLRIQEDTQATPIDLLILSACQTATGDRRAALGIAGAGFRAGARSVLATLWNVDDESTSRVVGTFYNRYLTEQTSKANALREAQIQLIKDQKAPYFWAPFVLVGRWG